MTQTDSSAGAVAEVGASAIYRYVVPVDDEWHDIDLTGSIVHVATRSARMVEFWAYHNPANPVGTVRMRVFGTGHPIPDDIEIRHVGTALIGSLVWHLIKQEHTASASSDAPLEQ